VAGADGSVSIGPTASLPIGVYSLTLRATDAAGNVGNPSTPFTLTIMDAALVDLEGDGKSDVALYRRATSQWLSQPTSSGTNFVATYGTANLVDIPVPGDYDGTGHTELAFFRPSTAQWFIQSPTGQRVVTFGATNLTDIPVPGDYDGVGYTEPAVFRPSSAQWIVLGPNGGHVVGTYGATNLTDIPVPGDYDGIGHTEMAVFRPSKAQWFVLGPTGGRLVGAFGSKNLVDIPVPGDYDGVGHSELAVFRPSTGQWFVLGPTGGRVVATTGATGLADLPLEASIASLKALGTVGGIRINSLGSGSTPRPQAEASGSTSFNSSRPSIQITNGASGYFGIAFARSKNNLKSMKRPPAVRWSAAESV
jgi:allophanate hydrolase subunit 1